MRHVIKRSHQNATEQRHRRTIRPQYLILLVLMALFAFKFVEKTQEVRSLAVQEAALRATNDATAQQNAQLRSAIAYDRTMSYVQNSARSEFGLALPNDIPVMVLSRHASYAQTPVRVPAFRPVSSGPAWKQWLHAFFG